MTDLKRNPIEFGITVIQCLHGLHSPDLPPLTRIEALDIWDRLSVAGKNHHVAVFRQQCQHDGAA